MDNNEIKLKIKNIIAEFLGVGDDDINEDDNLITDLHIKPADLSDLQNSINENGFDTGSLDFTQIETVEDLIDHLEDKNLAK